MVKKEPLKVKFEGLSRKRSGSMIELVEQVDACSRIGGREVACKQGWEKEKKRQ
jgi:hypothetical protein